jgi:carboxylesterase type B
MISIGHQNGYKYMSVPSKKPLFSKYIMDSGLLTLSKLKVAKSDFTQFKFHSGKDRYVYKGVLCSKILLGDTEFDYIKQS